MSDRPDKAAGRSPSASPPANPRASIGDSSVGAMDGVIASIRQAMRDGEPLATGNAEPPTARGSDGVLRLDPSMMVLEPSHPAPPAQDVEAASTAAEPAARTQPTLAPTPQAGLVSDITARAAVAAMAELRQMAGTTAASGGGGLTVEALVRQSLAPLLSGWLEQNLPGIVERVVRAEVERILDRS